MLKGYISRWERRQARESRIIDYWFTSNPNSAARTGKIKSMLRPIAKLFSIPESRFHRPTPSAVLLGNATPSVFHQRHIGRVLRSS